MSEDHKEYLTRREKIIRRDKLAFEVSLLKDQLDRIAELIESIEGRIDSHYSDVEGDFSA